MRYSRHLLILACSFWGAGALAQSNLKPVCVYSFESASRAEVGRDSAKGRNLDQLSGVVAVTTDVAPACAAVSGSKHSLQLGPKENGALWFDAGGLPSVLDKRQDNWGIELWVKVDAAEAAKQTEAQVVSIGRPMTSEDLSTHVGMGICRQPDGKGGSQWRGTLNGKSYVGVRPAPVEAGKWVHLAIVSFEGSSSFFVNGISVGSQTVPRPSDSPGTLDAKRDQLVLGCLPGGGSPFHGMLDEARVFTVDSGKFQTSDLQIHQAKKN